jgi:hypothetical protein
MSKRRKEKPDGGAIAPAASTTAQQLTALIAQGDNRAARARARQLLADGSSCDAERAAARDILERTGFDKGALLTAAVAVAVVVVILALVYLR